MTHDIKGVLPFLARTEHLFDVGCDGFVVGQVSEVLRLTREERLRVAELPAEAARGRGVSVMSTGAETPQAAVEYARHAREAGVDALLVMHPETIPLDDPGMVAYCSEVIEAVDIPVVIHHAKSLAKQPLSIAAQLRPGGDVDTTMPATCLPDEHHTHPTADEWAENAADHLLHRLPTQSDATGLTVN